MILLTSYHGTIHFESVALLSVALACAGSFYEGARRAEEEQG